MSMLDRYRKTGGFYQLVSLVETCAPAKQEKFIELIRAESPAWADAIKMKMLDINRIYSWNDETLAEIVGTLQDLTVATALHVAPENIKARLLSYLTHGRRRKIDDLHGNSQPSPGEIASTHMKIVETVRKMAHDGFIRLEKVDPPLFIDDKIEEELSKTQAAAVSAVVSATPNSHSDFTIQYEEGAQGAEATPPTPGAASNETPEAVRIELAAMRKKLTELSKENAVLRHELNLARGKLEQIKKIA